MPPYTLRMHSTNSNQVLYESNVHKYTLTTQIKTYNAGMCTHAHPMLRNTSKELKSNTCAPLNSKWPPKPQSSSKALQNSSKAPKAPPIVQTYTSNTHMLKTIRSEERLLIQLLIQKPEITQVCEQCLERTPTLLQPCPLFPSLYHHIENHMG